MLLQDIKRNLTLLREKKPLILNLTNYVTIDLMANALLSLGVAPIMSFCEAEAEELINMSGAININIGTLEDRSIEHALKTVKIAKRLSKPVVLDPVGVGATRIRTQTAKELLPYISVVKGNASEIIALWGDTQKTLGVESIHTTDQAQDSACHLASELNCVVVVSGKKDFITNGKQNIDVALGHPLMPYVTGMGCVLSAVIAAFCTVDSNEVDACSQAVTYFALCGMLAGNLCKEPGSFRTAFIDELFKADFEQMKKHYDQ